MRFTATTVRDIFQLELKFQFGWRLRTNFTELRFFLKKQMWFSFWSSRDRFSLDKPRYVNSLQYINAQYIYTFLFLKIAYMLNQGNFGYHGKLHFFASMAIYGNCHQCYHFNINTLNKVNFLENPVLVFSCRILMFEAMVES